MPTVGNAAALSAEKNGIPYLETGNPIEPFVAVKADSGGWTVRLQLLSCWLRRSPRHAYKFPVDLDMKTNMKTFISVDNSPDGPVFGPAAKGGRRGPTAGKSVGMETHLSRCASHRVPTASSPR